LVPFLRGFHHFLLDLWGLHGGWERLSPLETVRITVDY